MGRSNEHEDAVAQLYEALTQEEASEKNFHVRQAIQLLQLEQ